MNILHKTFSGLVVTLALLFTMPVAQAATYNFTITGDVLAGDELSPNAYNLTFGETITATGTFSANLGTIGNETGTIFFATGSGNTMTIDLNGTFLFAADDNGYGTGAGPSLTFSAGSLTDFDFLKNINTPAFSSYFLFFDDQDQMFGQWTNASLTVVPTVVPVPAAVWLFGSGLVSLIAIGRRKKFSARNSTNV